MLTRRVFILALSALIAASSGCTNPFSTGDPEFPEGDLVNYPQPTSAENVLATLVLALGAQDKPAYMERIGTEFRFYPDPVQLQSQEFNNFPADWTPIEEETFIASLLGYAGSVTLVWSNTSTRLEGTGAVISTDYLLDVVSPNSEIIHYSGRADLTMMQDAGIWYVESWRDVLTNSVSTTWGLLRAQLLTAG
jgi:hypothetical protein